MEFKKTDTIYCGAVFHNILDYTKETIFRGEITLAVGIQFQDLSPKLRGMLFVFADDSKI